jgi:putative holliday junction resolvase
MGRILAIDFGKKRTGLAITDPLKIIATSLTTVETAKLFAFLQDYFGKEEVETIVLGWPLNLKSEATDATESVIAFKNKFEGLYPGLPIILQDERFTSKMAVRTMIDSGMKKKDRRVKGNIDMISAVIILQSYLLENQ